MEHALTIWEFIALVLIIVVISKMLSKMTRSVDVLWLIIFWAIIWNLWFMPENIEWVEFVWELWIIFVMFALWFEEDVHLFLKWIKRSWWIAIFWAIFPFMAWYFVSIYLWYWTNAAILWWLTMTATAVSLTMIALKNCNLHRSSAATWIMTAAVIDDVLSLIWVAIIIPFVVISSWNWADPFSIITIIIIIAKVVAFFAIAVLIRIFIFHDRESKFLLVKYPFLKKIFKFTNKFFSRLWVKKILIMYEWEFSPLILLTIAVCMWVVSEIFWFHPAIWAYMIWLILQKHHFTYFDKSVQDSEIYIKTKFVVEHVAFTIFGPIFFVLLWTKILVDIKILEYILPWALLLFITVFIFQVISASVAARYTWKYSWNDSIMIWFWMLWRAELAFIVIEIAYVDENIIDLNQFYILIFTTFFLNISVPMLIKFWSIRCKSRKICA